MREWLGGLDACGVFASVLFFCPLLFFFAYLLGLCLCCSRLVLLPALFVLVSLWVLCFLFPLRTIRKKERAQRFCPLCPLLFCCVCLDSCIVIKKFRCRCFGFFQFIRFVLPSNTARVGRLARSYFLFPSVIRQPLGLRNYCRRFQFLMNYRKSKPRKIGRYYMK